MRFLEAWTQLPAAELLRWLLPLGIMGALVVLPGRLVARLGAIGVAIALALTPALIPLAPLRIAWAALWIAIAWGVVSPRAPHRPVALTRRLGLVETGTIGLLLGLALVALLVVAIARQDLPDDESRRASYGILVLCFGLLHLMLHRHTVRAAVAIAMLGLGLQIVERVAADALVADPVSSPYGTVLATMLGCAIAVRIGRTRERVATSPWVADAHDLHD